jgi:hypothetical protein
MAVTINNQHATYNNVKDTFPQSESITGTCSTMSRKDRIIGSGTLFTTELQPGDFLYDATNTEIRKIISIESATELTVDEEFSNTLSVSTLKKTPPIGYQSIAYLIDSTSGETVDGQLLPDGATGTYAVNSSPSTTRRPRPLILDSTTNDGKIIVTFFA